MVPIVREYISLKATLIFDVEILDAFKSNYTKLSSDDLINK